MEPAARTQRNPTVLGGRDSVQPGNRQDYNFSLEKAVGTAEYGKHAKAERVGEEDRFTQRVNDLVSATPFPLAYLAYFAVLNRRDYQASRGLLPSRCGIRAWDGQTPRRAVIVMPRRNG